MGNTTIFRAPEDIDRLFREHCAFLRTKAMPAKQERHAVEARTALHRELLPAVRGFLRRLDHRIPEEIGTPDLGLDRVDEIEFRFTRAGKRYGIRFYACASKAFAYVDDGKESFLDDVPWSADGSVTTAITALYEKVIHPHL